MENWLAESIHMEGRSHKKLVLDYLVQIKLLKQVRLWMQIIVY